MQLCQNANSRTNIEINQWLCSHNSAILGMPTQNKPH